MILLMVAWLLAQGVPADAATVSGRLTYRDGKAAPNIRVMAMPVDEADAAGSTMTSLATTDSDGRYRLENLKPGRYYIAAGLVQSPTYFPGVAARPAAGVVTIVPGKDINRLDFPLMTFRVAGRVVRVNAQPVSVGPGNDVRLTMASGPALTTAVARDGTFRFENVQPGTFSLGGRTPLRTGRAQVVVADRDVTDVLLVLDPIKTINGRVIVEGGGPQPRFALNAVDPPGSPGGTATPVKLMVATERTFTLRMAEGEYPISVAQESLPEGYTVKALRYGRLDLLKQPLRVDVTDTADLVVTLQSPRVRRAGVSGRIVAYDPTYSPAVVRFESGSFVEVPTALVRNDGSFRISDLMPGRYTLTSTLSGASAPSITVGASDIEDIEIVLPSRAAANPESMIGSLSWVIYEAFSGAVVDRGGGTFRIKDVGLQESGTASNIRTRKTIALNNQFSLEMSEPATEWMAEKTSLTFTARHKDLQTSSYAGLRIQSSGRATRPQDSSEVAVAIAEVAPKRWEVTRTEFLTDLSIEVTHPAMVPRGSPYWRVVILKGSSITWPSLINGRTVGN